MLSALVQFVKHRSGAHSEQVVLYDKSGVFSAPRVWWTFRAFGHERQAATLVFPSALRRHVVFLFPGIMVPQHAHVRMLVS